MTSMWHAGWSTQTLGAELAGLSYRDLGLAGLVTLGVVMIFLGWLVPYRLVRRKDYERVMTLLEEAQATNTTNAETMKATAAHKDLATAVVEELRKSGSTNRGSEPGGDPA